MLMEDWKSLIAKKIRIIHSGTDNRSGNRYLNMQYKSTHSFIKMDHSSITCCIMCELIGSTLHSS